MEAQPGLEKSKLNNSHNAKYRRISSPSLVAVGNFSTQIIGELGKFEEGLPIERTARRGTLLAQPRRWADVQL
jgi:hypothetical protein